MKIAIARLWTAAWRGDAVNAAYSELPLLSALELRRLIAAGDVTPREAAAACLERILAVDPGIRAFVTLDEKMTMAMADDVARRLKSGEAPLLAGVPYALKDLTDSAGLRTTYGSKLREHYVPAQRCRGRPPAAGSGRGAARQDQHARVRQSRDHRLRPLPGDAQPLEPEQDRRRIERRFGGGRRRLPLSGRGGFRWRRLHPASLELLRSRRPQAVARTRLECARTPIRAADSSPSGRSREPCVTPR